MKKQQKLIKMTYDIVFKKFFTDRPDLLKILLIHFLGIDAIQDLTIKNPKIPTLEHKHTEKYQCYLILKRNGVIF